MVSYHHGGGTYKGPAVLLVQIFGGSGLAAPVLSMREESTSRFEFGRRFWSCNQPWGHGAVQNKQLRHEEPSEKLLVMLPGRKNSCETGLLCYLRGMALLQGFDVLSLEYGFQVGRTERDGAVTPAQVHEAVGRARAVIGTADGVCSSDECRDARARGDMEWLVVEG